MTGIGLAPTPVSRRAHEALEPVLTPEERRDLAWRLGGVLAAGTLLLAGLAHRALGGPPEVAGLILGAGALVAAGPVLAAGVRGFWRGDPNAMVDQLVSVALLAALAGGEFETAILIPLLLALGHFLEERSVLGARAAIEGLKRLRTTTASRLTGEGEVTVPVEDLTPGDRIAIRPGEAVPADGRVLRGASAVDQSSMTGEAVPEDVAPGSPVFAGTVNLSGVLASYRQLFAITFHEELAYTSGVRVGALNLMLTMLTALTTVVAMRMVGVLLVSAMIVIPTLTGFALARSFRQATVFAIGTALLAVGFGLVAAYYLRLAAGGTIVLAALLLLAGAAAWRRLASALHRLVLAKEASR